MSGEAKAKANAKTRERVLKPMRSDMEKLIAKLDKLEETFKKKLQAKSKELKEQIETLEKDITDVEGMLKQKYPGEVEPE